MGEQLADRQRPPRDWFLHDEFDDRPHSSSFPSGHTAAAFAFTAAVTPTWPPPRASRWRSRRCW
ncbi:phosphatase PAP2 family protein [Streptomyces sp. NBC_00490]|uniref:phosphatase PAP2 family protein n=1 Tax=Streptomyces sp. NBC_00490 TaxID=2903657 RepID=UPI002E1887A2